MEDPSVSGAFLSQDFGVLSNQMKDGDVQLGITSEGASLEGWTVLGSLRADAEGTTL